MAQPRADAAGGCPPRRDPALIAPRCLGAERAGAASRHRDKTNLEEALTRMIAADQAFDGTFPFAPHFSTAAGFQMHYVDEGEGEPIVCLHGEPTWGYVYRRFIAPLSETNRVIVPDHMGFGKSETP